MYRLLFKKFLVLSVVLSLMTFPLLAQSLQDINQSVSPLPLVEKLSKQNVDTVKNPSLSSSYLIQDFITMIFDTHPNIKMYHYMIKGAQSGIDTAKWNYFPTPTLETSYTTKNIDGTTVAIEQPLWTGGKLDAAYDMAVANKVASQFGLKENGYLLIETLINTVQMYLKAKEDLVALDNGKERLLRLEDMIVRREDSGVSSKADIELVKARIFQTETSINAAKNKKAIALAQLELLTGHKIEDTLMFNDFQIYNTIGTSDVILKYALSMHPSLEKLDAQIDYAKAERDKAKAAIMPNVSVKAQKIFGSSSLYYNTNENDAVVYLAVQATPGAGLSSLSSREMAEARVMQLAQEKNSKKQDIIDKTLSAYNNYMFANSRIDIQVNSINASQNVFDSYIRLFLTGKRQWLDLISASRELTDNELAYNDTKIMRLIASYQLALLEGKFNAFMRLDNDSL
ncbi:MAG: TolC family protein [Sulfurospirillaceae bacterium]|nr:TolC family protein [Sulfurospirillaceae bacterium]MDD2825943.1 TolC family protein [Sulfurospirillaceae bacterium]